MAVKEANSLLFCILTTACLKTNVLKFRKDISCLTFILLLWQKILWSYTHLFNQFTDDCVVEILYCCPLNTLQSKCKFILYSHVCEYTETTRIHSEEGHEWNPQGNGKRARPQQAHKIGRAGGETVASTSGRSFFHQGQRGLSEWATVNVFIYWQ